MLRCLTLVALIYLSFNVLAADGPQLAPVESAGIRSLFNGKDLAGRDGDPRPWSVKNGVIRGETTT